MAGEEGRDGTEPLAGPAETESAVTPSPPTVRGVASFAAPRGIVPGDCVGRYTVRAFVGAGGMGTVFAADDPHLGRRVALKVIHAGVRSSSRARARMLREARALARLHHSNVVTVHDVGAQDDRVFIAMELVEGPTLARWLREAPRGWREILDTFLAAGRGLAAAHALGIVHRDFKPANVIVGARVVVVDFGLARDAGDEAGATPDEESEAQRPLAGIDLTLTGERLGTPLFMAPEQRTTAAVTARADQFSFCLALWAALHGELPRPDAAASPRRPEVPGWLNAALLRGLARDPEARWPSMDALLATLGRDRRAARRRVLAVGAGALAVAAALALPRAALRPVDPCAWGEAMAAAIWDAPARARVSEAFARSGRPYAADSFARVDATVRQRLAGWAAAHRETCEATQVRHEQSGALLDLRMACLRRARDDAATFVALLGEADGRAVDGAAAAVARLADPSPCADAAALRETVPPPRDPAAAREDGAVRLEAGRIAALEQLGRGRDGLAAAHALVPRARALGHAPALAVALRAASSIEYDAGDTHTADELGYEALRAAEEAHDDLTRAEVATLLVFSVGYRQRRYGEAEALGRIAVAAIARAGNPPRLVAALHNRLGSVLEAKGETTVAYGHYMAELGWAMRDAGWRSRPVALALNDLRDIEENLGDPRTGLRTSEASLRVLEGLVGREHPWIATSLSGVAYAQMILGELDDAATTYERAVAIVERAYGEEHEMLGILVGSLAEVRTMQGRLDEAAALVTRASRIFERLDPRSVGFVNSLEMLAEVAMRQGRLDEAQADASRAVALRLEIEGPDAFLTGRTLGKLGEIQRRRGQLGDARASIERELVIFEKALGRDHADTAIASCALGEVLASQGQGAVGVARCEAALAIVARAYGEKSTAAVEIAAFLAKARRRHGRAI